MSETPTNYDLVQDARIGPMEQILSQAAEPPNATSYSYPVVGQGWSTEMWRRINRNAGNGILAEGGRPFWIRNRDNANNTATISVSTLTGEAAAVMHGFYFAMDSDETVSLPALSSGSVVYHICLTYDPRNEKNAEGPIALKVHPGTPPTTFGREHIILWTVNRSANQLLTDAPIEMTRPFVGGVVTVNYESQLPNPDSVLAGTIGISRLDGTLHYSMARGEGDDGESASEWVNLLDPPWRDNLLNVGYEWQGFGHPPGTQKVGNTVKTRGTIRLSSGGNFQPGERYRVLYMPTGRRPTGTRYAIGADSRSGSSPGYVRYTFDPDGSLFARVSHRCSWISIDNMQFDIE